MGTAEGKGTFGEFSVTLSLNLAGMYITATATQLDGSTSEFSRNRLVKVGSISAVTLTAPNGGEIWPINSTHTITWISSGLTGNVKIELSRDGGTTFETPFGSTANDESESWTVPGPASSTCLVKISSVDDPAISDLSDAAFIIRTPSSATITVAEPNGGETWTVNTTETIRWTSSGFKGKIKIELSRNGGSTWETLFANTADNGSQKWTVTGPPSTTCRIRVSSVDDPTITDTSDADFRISPPSITVVSPNGGENWLVASRQTIRWTSLEVKGKVKIELSRDRGSTFETLFASTADDGAESWTVIGPASTQCRMRISSVDNTAVADTNDANFTISQPSITVTVPNGGENWAIGSTQTIAWSSSGVSGSVKIELSRDGGTTWEVLFASTANDLSEAWIVTQPRSNQCRVRITSVDDPTITDTSNANFNIVLPSITVTVPNGGENWGVGSAQTIRWTSNGVSGNVKIDLSRDGGATWEVLFASTVNDGSESWLVTEPTSSQCRIRISSLNDPNYC